jgi:hypothetical protein
LFNRSPTLCDELRVRAYRVVAELNLAHAAIYE